MRRPSPRTFIFVAVLAVALPVVAQTVEALLLQISIESELLVGSLSRYRGARIAELNALSRLDAVASRVDGQIERGNPRLAELRRLESELIEASEIAAARLRQTALARREVYDHRQRLILLERRLAEAGGGRLLSDSGVSGLWQMQMEPGEVFGLLRIEADGTLLGGTYVLSNGEQGSIRGALIGDQVEIQRVDTARGFVDTLQGEVDLPRGSMEGRWTGNDLAPADGPTTGTWTGRRLSRSVSGGSLP